MGKSIWPTAHCGRKNWHEIWGPIERRWDIPTVCPLFMCGFPYWSHKRAKLLWTMSTPGAHVGFCQQDHTTPQLTHNYPMWICTDMSAGKYLLSFLSMNSHLRRSHHPRSISGLESTQAVDAISSLLTEAAFGGRRSPLLLMQRQTFHAAVHL